MYTPRDESVEKPGHKSLFVVGYKDGLYYRYDVIDNDATRAATILRAVAAGYLKPWSPRHGRGVRSLYLSLLFTVGAIVATVVAMFLVHPTDGSLRFSSVFTDVIAVVFFLCAIFSPLLSLKYWSWRAEKVSNALAKLGA